METRTAKYLALLLFVTLPFAGGYVGYSLSHTVAIPTVEQQSANEDQSDAVATDQLTGDCASGGPFAVDNELILNIPVEYRVSSEKSFTNIVGVTWIYLRASQESSCQGALPRIEIHRRLKASPTEFWAAFDKRNSWGLSECVRNSVSSPIVGWCATPAHQPDEVGIMDTAVMLLTRGGTRYDLWYDQNPRNNHVLMEPRMILAGASD